MVNGNSPLPDSEDGIRTERGVYIESGQGLYLTPPEISQFGFAFKENFTMNIWIYPIGTNTHTLLKKGTFLELRLEPSLSEIHTLYNGHPGSLVNANATGNFHSDKWGLIGIVHRSDSTTQTLKVFYNDIPGTSQTFTLTFADASYQQLVLGSSQVTMPFKGLIYDLKIYDGLIPDSQYNLGFLFEIDTGNCYKPEFINICISTETDPLKNFFGDACGSCPGSCRFDMVCIVCDPSCNGFCLSPVDPAQCVDLVLLCAPVSFDISIGRCDWPDYCTSNCATCTNTNECVSCELGYDLQPDLSCSVGCPSGYASVAQKCISCHPDCASCVGTSQSECSTCSDPFTMLNNGSCVCQTNYFSNSGSCTQCDSTCATCDGGGEENCLSCIDSLKVAQDEGCVCKEGYYSDHSICVACHSDCQTCNGPLKTQCTSCINPTNRIDNGSCVCEEGFYKDTEGTCQACHSECSSCDGPSVSDCLECSNSEASPENGCVCERGYFLDDTCKPCPSECTACTSSEECLECSDSKKEIIEGRCKCKEGYCENKKECLDCDAIPLETEQTTEGMIGAGSLGGSIALGFISMLTLDDPAVIWTITNIAQIICYLAILDLPISGSFFQFLISYQTVGFFPNFFLGINDDSCIPVEYQKFGYLKEEYRDTNFIKNSGRYIELILIILIVYLIMYLISLVLPENLKEKIRKITSCWISSMLRVVLVVFLDFCIAISVIILGNHDEFTHFSGKVCVIFLVMFLFTPFGLLMLNLFKRRIKSKDTSVTKYIGSLYSGLNLDSCFSYYLEVILSIRRLTYAAILYIYRKEPLIVLISQCACSIFLAFYIVCGKIYEKKTNAAINCLSEFILSFTLIGLVIIHSMGGSVEIENILMGVNIFFILAASVSNPVVSCIQKLLEKKRKANVTPVIRINPDNKDKLFSASEREIIYSSRAEENRLTYRNHQDNNYATPSNNNLDITVISNWRLMLNRRRISNNVIYINDEAD